MVCGVIAALLTLYHCLLGVEFLKNTFPVIDPSSLLEKVSKQIIPDQTFSVTILLAHFLPTYIIFGSGTQRAHIAIYGLLSRGLITHTI